MLLSKTYLDLIREIAVKDIKEIEKQVEKFRRTISLTFEERKQYQQLILGVKAYTREVDNLYYLYLLEDRSIEYHKKDIFLNEFVRDFINSLDYVDKNDIYFEKIIDESCGVNIDEKKLKVVFENIILRILRTLTNGKITVRVREIQDDLSLEIIDSSRGLDENTVRNFKEVPDIDRRYFDNLDLFVSCKILKDQGQDFDIEKETDFTKYIITFHKVETMKKTEAKTILIVDDDMEFIRLIQLFQHKFSKSGYEVEYRSTAKDGIERVKEKMPDIVLLDLMLPDSTGIQVCEEIRKINKRVPVIMLTAYGSALDEKKAYEVGVNHFINKSYNFKDLLEQIQRFI
ncbi:MAG: response regulator [Armatimonadota bacterium]